jgi:hypothetical protein
MRRSIPFLLGVLCAVEGFSQAAPAPDTSAIVANIGQYMMLVDRLPVMASYARMTASGQAEPLEPGAAMPPGCVEFIELIGDSARKVVGAVVYKAQQAHEVKEATFHYFDRRYNTVCVRHELKWLDNHCSFSYAVRNDFHYFHPPRTVLQEYTTLTDTEGNNLSPETCVFPDVKRQMEMYNHLDMFLLMERVKM